MAEEKRSLERDTSIDLRNNGTFRWTTPKDRLLLIEVRTIEPFKFKKNTKESGTAWSEVASGVNQHLIFQASPRSERSVRERFQNLMKEFRAKMRKEEGESGTIPNPLSENETLLEEIDEKMKSAKTELDAATAKEGDQQKNDRKKAMAARDAAMKTWSKTAAAADSDDEGAHSGGRGRKRRRGSGGALEFLETKRQDDAELRKEEMGIRRDEIALQSKRQEQFEKQMLQQQQHIQQQALQQQQQFTMQQQQAQQMQQLMVVMLQKMSKE